MSSGSATLANNQTSKPQNRRDSVIQTPCDLILLNTVTITSFIITQYLWLPRHSHSDVIPSEPPYALGRGHACVILPMWPWSCKPEPRNLLAVFISSDSQPMALAICTQRPMRTHHSLGKLRNCQTHFHLINLINLSTFLSTHYLKKLGQMNDTFQKLG